MMNLFKAFMARAMSANTEAEWEQLIEDVDIAYVLDKIKEDENELLYRLIRRLYH